VTEEIAQLKTNLQHVDIHNHWLHQEVQKDLITVEYTESALMMADGLTKALTNNAFERFVEQMNLKDVSNLLAERRLNDLEELKLDQMEPVEVDQDENEVLPTD